MKVIKYRSELEEEWNCFNSSSKNQLFMFNRKFMEYHKDRFTDYSLMFYDDNDELIAILPMSSHCSKLISHGGLTYGGFIVNSKMKQHLMNKCFEKMLEYIKINGFDEILYKTIPHFYHRQPAEEDRYSLFLNNASIRKIEPATVLSLKNPIHMAKGRKAQISRAKREGVVVKELYTQNDFDKFIELENKVLSKYHNTQAVHTGKELYLLHSRFPENIRLYAAMFENEMISGAVIFEYDKVIHTQYLAADETARRIGALDLVISNLINVYKDSKLWLDFGISTENNGLILNEGLISQKEGFGARTVVYETWSLKIK